MELNLTFFIVQTSLDAHSVQVVVVSFGRQEGATHWLKETGCRYDMLLDPDRKVRGQHHAAEMQTTRFINCLIDKQAACWVLQVYAAFGLEASVKKVLNFSNMLLYAEYVADNMEFPRGLPSLQDDMFQVNCCCLKDIIGGRRQQNLAICKHVLLCESEQESSGYDPWQTRIIKR